MLSPVSNKGIGTEAVYAPEKQNWDLGQVQIDANYLMAAQQDPFAMVYSRAVRNEVKKKFNKTRSKKYLLDIGDFHLLHKSYARAEQAYVGVLKESKYSLQALRKLINLSIVRKDTDKVIKYFDQLIYESDNNVNYLIEKVSFLLSNYSPQVKSNVKGTLKHALNVDSSNEELLILSGIFNILERDLNKADSYFRKAISLDAKNVHAINNIGVIYSLKDDLKNAEVQYKKALQIDAHYTSGYENLASLYLRQNKPSSALSILDDALSNDIDLSEAWDHNYGYLLLQNNKLDQAISWYKNKIQQEPDNNLLYNNLGKCYENQNSIRMARRYYERATEIARVKVETNAAYDDRLWSSFYNLMHMYQKAEQWNKLDNLVSFVEQYRPNDWKVLFHKALVKIDKYEYRAAISLLREVLSFNEGFVDARINLAFLLETVEKKYAEAIKLLKPMSKDLGPNPIIDNNLIFAYIKSYKLVKAKKLLDIYRAYDDYPPLTASRGLYFYYIGQPSKADKEYKKAVDKISSKLKKVATQIWLNEQAQYFLARQETKKALEAINKSLASFKEGYSYEDALAIKEAILNQ